MARGTELPRHRLAEEALEGSPLYQFDESGNLRLGRVFRDSGRKWVPSDLRIGSLSDFVADTNAEVERIGKGMRQEAESGGSMATYNIPRLLLERRIDALRVAGQGGSLETEVLLFSVKEDDYRKSKPFKTKGLDFLESFMDLGTGSAEKILNYAKRNGPLGLCEHGLPAWHSKQTFFDRPRCVPIGMEPIPRWRLYASVVGAILVGAPRLLRGVRMRDGDWRTLCAYGAFPDSIISKLDSVHGQRSAITGVLQQWAEWGELGPRYQWTDSGFVVDEGATGLFGKIVRELVYVVSKRKGRISCDHCGKEFIPKRARKWGFFCRGSQDCVRAADNFNSMMRDKMKKM